MIANPAVEVAAGMLAKLTEKVRLGDGNSRAILSARHSAGSFFSIDSSR